MANSQPTPSPTSPAPVPVGEEQTDLFKKTSFDHFDDVQTDELVIALCGPVGSPLPDVSSMLKAVLEDKFNYEATEIKLSAFIERHVDKKEVLKDQYDRIKALISAGNSLRSTYGAAVLAELAVFEIAHSRAEIRLKADEKRNIPLRRCHIVNSIKNKEELDLLRKIYGSMFFCIGVFSPHRYRVELLSESMELSKVHELIQEDADSGGEEKTGQMVDETFFYADYFLRFDQSTSNKVKSRLERFLDIVITPNVATPTLNETAMYSAAAAAWNSACLSRQVGASILSKSGELIAVGWNDVPQAHGGLYRTNESQEDHRCYLWKTKECHNDAGKNRITENLINRLLKNNFIKPEDKGAIKKIVESELKQLIEFSRSIHAEMHAIISAAHSGSGEMLKGAMLFCTTYPCHSCARHLIAAGIDSIYYIEPYPKSKAMRLHGDALSDLDNETNKVRLIPYDGIAPRRYRLLFEMKTKRKEGGKVKKYHPKETGVSTPTFLESFTHLESIVVKTLQERSLIK